MASVIAPAARMRVATLVKLCLISVELAPRLKFSKLATLSRPVYGAGADVICSTSFSIADAESPQTSRHSHGITMGEGSAARAPTSSAAKRALLGMLLGVMIVRELRLQNVGLFQFRFRSPNPVPSRCIRAYIQMSPMLAWQLCCASAAR